MTSISQKDTFKQYLLVYLFIFSNKKKASHGDFYVLLHKKQRH